MITLCTVSHKLDKHSHYLPSRSITEFGQDISLHSDICYFKEEDTYIRIMTEKLEAYLL